MKTNNVAVMLLAVGFGMGSGDHAAAQGQPSAFPSVVPDSAKGAGIKRGSSEMETSSGTFGNGDTPPNASGQFIAQGCYDYWWISGNHKYTWTWAWAYSKANIYGKTLTQYGGATASCNIPLIVDKIEVYGDTVQEVSGSVPKAIITKVLYNTDFVDASGSASLFGVNLGFPCGARALHKATKNGVTWKTSTSSGCGANPLAW